MEWQHRILRYYKKKIYGRQQRIMRHGRKEEKADGMRRKKGKERRGEEQEGERRKREKGLEERRREYNGEKGEE